MLPKGMHVVESANIYEFSDPLFDNLVYSPADYIMCAGY